MALQRIEIPEVVLDANGVPITGAQVEIRKHTDNTLAAVYDAGGALTANPLVTSYGRIEGYVAEGRYNLVVLANPTVGIPTGYTQAFEAQRAWPLDDAAQADERPVVARGTQLVFSDQLRQQAQRDQATYRVLIDGGYRVKKEATGARLGAAQPGDAGTVYNDVPHAVAAVLTDAGDVPLRIVVAAKAGGAPHDLVASQAWPDMTVRASDTWIEGEDGNCKLRGNNTAPKPFTFAAGTVGTWKKYNAPNYRNVTIDANFTGQSNKKASWFGKNEGTVYCIFTEQRLRDVVLLGGGSPVDPKTGRQWFWCDHQVEADNSYDPTTAAWQYHGGIEAINVVGAGATQAHPHGVMGGNGFCKVTAKAISGKNLLVALGRYYCQNVWFDTGIIPTTTFHSAGFFLGGHAYPAEDMVLLYSGAYGVPDVAVQADGVPLFIVDEGCVFENSHSVLLTGAVNPYVEGKQHSYFVNSEIRTNGRDHTQCEGLSLSGSPGVVDSGLLEMDWVRTFMAPSIPDSARRVIKALPGHRFRPKGRVTVLDTGWTQARGALTGGAYVKHYFYWGGGTATRPVRLDLDVLVRIRGTYDRAVGAGGTGEMYLDGHWFKEGSYYDVDLRITLDPQIGAPATVSVASPAVVTTTSAHGLAAGDAVRLRTTGKLPDGIDATLTYYVLAAGLTATAFQFARTPGGAAVATTGAQYGTHKVLTTTGNLGLAAGHLRPIRHLGTTGQEDLLSIDATAGTFVVYDDTHGTNTGALSWNPGSTALQTALAALDASYAGKVAVSTPDEPDTYVIDWDSSLGVLNIRVDASGLTGTAFYENQIPYNNPSHIMGRVEVRWAGDAAGVPATKVESWDDVALCQGTYQSVIDNTNAPVGATAQQYGSGGPPANFVDASQAGLDTRYGAFADAGVKTGAYTAAAGQLVRCDTTGGAFTVQLPNAPLDRTRVCVKHVVQGGANAVTVQCQGADVLNVAGGATTRLLQLSGSAATFHYLAASKVWVVVNTDESLTALDARYGNYVGSGTLAARPLASAVPNGAVYLATDDLDGSWYQSNTLAWAEYRKGQSPTYIESFVGVTAFAVTANDALLSPFMLSGPTLLAHMGWAISTTDATGHYDVGIYDMAAQAIYRLGPTLYPSSADNTHGDTIAPTTLRRGQYFQAWATDSGTAQIKGQNTGAGGTAANPGRKKASAYSGGLPTSLSGHTASTQRQTWFMSTL